MKLFLIQFYSLFSHDTELSSWLFWIRLCFDDRHRTFFMTVLDSALFRQSTKNFLILDTSRYRLCKWNYGIKWYRMRSSSVIHYWVYPVYVSWDLREPVDTTATSCPVTHETCDWPVVTCVLAHQRTATVTLSNERKRKLINFIK